MYIFFIPICAVAMFRLQWNLIPDNKAIWIGLTYVYGIWLSRSKSILEDMWIPLEMKVKDLSEEQRKALTDKLKDMILENDLRREVWGHIKRLKEIKCYRWMRHNLWLPVRWQNTRKRWATAKKLLWRSRVRPVLKK